MVTIDCCSVASTRTSMAGSPSTRVMMSSSTNPSRISATSPTVRIEPSSRVITGMSSNSSPNCRFETVCSTRPPASVRSSPKVKFREARRIASEIWLMESPLRRSSTSLSSIEISRSLVPTSVTWETDGSSSSPSRNAWAASRNSFSVADVDETESVRTSISTRLYSISGCSAETGGKFSMRSTAFLTSSRTAAASAKVASSTVTWASPS